MSSHERTHPTDILSKIAIVALLVGAMWLLHRFGMPGDAFDARSLLALGFVILAAFAVGELFEVVGLPHITGYLLCGVLLGPSTAEQIHPYLPWLDPPFDEGILTVKITEQLSLLDDLALALIALTAGGELHLESLRKGLGRILALLGGQVVWIGALMIGFIVLIGGSIPAIALPQLAQADSTLALISIGCVVASISLATSPAATIAIINGTRARGPMTDDVLSVVVLKDVLVVVGFSASMTFAAAMLGGTTEVTFLESLLHIALSIGAGAVLGAALHLYLRYVDTEHLLFLIGVIYTTTYLVEQFHGEAALTFIVAGFVVANFSSQGERMIHNVEHLAMPVYVVFFTLAGAKLHLDVLAQMAPFAAAIVLVRVAAIWLGNRTGTMLSGASPATTRYGWLGFISQAGLAITLATSVKESFPGEIGDGLFSLLLAGVAVNEMFGPVLFQFGLNMAKETESTRERDTAPHAPQSASDEVSVTDQSDPWGDPLPTLSGEIQQVLDHLRRETKALAAETQERTLYDHHQELLHQGRSLRRHYLAFHRSLHGLASQTEDDLPQEKLQELLGQLGENWSHVVMTRRAIVTHPEIWSPVTLLPALEALTEDLPHSLAAPYLPETLTARDEGRWKRFRRLMSRAAVRVGSTTRSVPMRDVARYHLVGEMASKLEGLAAGMVCADLEVCSRTTFLFDELSERYALFIRENTSGTPTDERVAKLEALKAFGDERFQEYLDMIRGLLSDNSSRCAAMLGSSYRQIEADLQIIGTVDLSHSERRFSRILQSHDSALEILNASLPRVWKAVGSHYDALAMHLEWFEVNNHVDNHIRRQSELLSRRLQAQGPQQVQRSVEELTAAIETASKAIDNRRLSPAKLGERLESVLVGVTTTMNDAHGVIRSLASDIEQERHLTPLTDMILEQCESLTEHYMIPAQRLDAGEWSLPTSYQVRTVALREHMLRIVESTIRSTLVSISQTMADEVSRLTETLNELTRIVTSNLELALAEIDGAEEVDAETREILRELLVGSLQRKVQHASTVHAHAITATQQSIDDLQTSIHETLSTVYERLTEPSSHITEVGLFGSDGSLGQLLADVIANGQRTLEQVNTATSEALQRWLDVHEFASLTEALGLGWDQKKNVKVFKDPTCTVNVPGGYLRLFMTASPDTHTLAASRQRELEHLQHALARPAPARCAALISYDPISIEMIWGHLNRNTKRDHARRIEVTKVTDLETIDAWFSDDSPQTTTLITGVQWLFRMGPAGAQPFNHLMRHLGDAKGRWVLHVEPIIWETLNTLTEVQHTVSDAIHIEALTATEMQEVLIKRHQMSGYGLRLPNAHLVQRLIDIWADPARPQHQAHQRAWFRNLHQLTHGNVSDALGYWIQAIDRFDEGSESVRLRAITDDKRAQLAHCSPDTLRILRMAMRQGWLDTEHLCTGLQLHPSSAHTALQHFVQRGLLQPSAEQPECWLVPNHLKSALHRTLQARRWA